MIEHEGAVNKSDKISVVAMHSEISGHCFDFEKPKILDTVNWGDFGRRNDFDTFFKTVISN